MVNPAYETRYTDNTLHRPSAPGLSPWEREWTHPRTGETYELSLTRSTLLAKADMTACFRLVEETSRQAYEKSSRKWRPRHKQTEMRLPDLRYILVKDATGALGGFTSLMPTYEEGQPVVYCYEIHLKTHLQG